MYLGEESVLYNVLPFIILLFTIGIHIAIFIYVYYDAKKRGMESIVWAIIAALAPMFLGFIAYIIISRHYIKMKCPNCGYSVDLNWNTCPNCGQTLPNNKEKSNQNVNIL